MYLSYSIPQNTYPLSLRLVKAGLAITALAFLMILMSTSIPGPMAQSDLQPIIQVQPVPVPPQDPAVQFSTIHAAPVQKFEELRPTPQRVATPVVGK
jgi:hypothetical protein